MNHLVELQYVEKENTGGNVRRIDKTHYQNIKTGEIHEYIPHEDRKDSVNSLRQTFKRLGYLINTNFCGRKNELWITLTYREKEYDHKQLAKDYELFLKRLKYHSKKQKWGELAAIGIKEPYADGSWHLHMLLKFPHRKKYLSKIRNYANCGEMALLK